MNARMPPSNHAAIRWELRILVATGEVTNGSLISTPMNINDLYGRHDWIRTSDLFRVKHNITFTFNCLTARGVPPKHLYSRVRRMSFG